MLNFKLKKSQSANANIGKNEYGVENFLPYKRFLDYSTVILKNNWMMKVIKLDGFSFETADDEDVDIRKNARNQLFRGMAAANFCLYFHTIRRRQDACSDGFAKSRMKNFFTDDLNRRWIEKNSRVRSFVNEIYITVVRKEDNKGLAFFENLINKFNQATSSKAQKEHWKNAFEELNEMTNRIAASLRDYSPRILGVDKTEAGDYSEVLEFLAKLVNGGEGGKVLMPKMQISDCLPSRRMYFGDSSIEIMGHSKSKYAGIVSVKEYGQNTSAGMLDVFLQLPFEFIITQSYQFTNRQVAINRMQLQQNRLIQSEDKAVSQIAEISRALDDAMSGRIAFGEHHLTVMCMDDDLRSLDGALSLVEAELINAGLYSVREKINMEPCFWAQLPGNFDFIVRKAIINTINLAGFASMHNYPVGSKDHNHWGEAVTILETTSGTPYFFNFHVRDVGHTTIIGPTGSGKTVLMNFLCAQAMKFRPRLFFFDKDRGAEIFIRSIGGVHTTIEPRTPSGFNPLQLEDSPENRTFLLEWMRTLVTTHGETLTSTDIAVLNEAIDGNFKLDKKDRRLSNLIAFMGVGGPGSLASRMEEWYGVGGHASLFDNEEDHLNFENNDTFCFEMAHVLKDPIAMNSTLLYLFHKINISLDGRPTMIVLDEAWALIDNDVFAPKIKDWLKVLRKLNAFVVFATQSVEDASNSQISDTLIQQTATQIFLPNLKATDVYQKVFMLSEREYVIVKHTEPSSRYFLVKQANNSIVARVDMGDMSDVIDVLSARTESVLLMDQLIAEYGENPDDWLPIFKERVKNV